MWEQNYTWVFGDRTSCIDYVLTTPTISTKLAKLTINEEGVASVGCNHNRILTLFGGPRPREMVPVLPRRVP